MIKEKTRKSMGTVSTFTIEDFHNKPHVTDVIVDHNNVLCKSVKIPLGGVCAPSYFETSVKILSPQSNGRDGI